MLARSSPSLKRVAVLSRLFCRAPISWLREQIRRPSFPLTTSEPLTTVAQFNVTHKIEQIIAGCEANNVSILATQDHRLKTTDDLHYKPYGEWQVRTNSSHESHGTAILYNKQIASLVASVVRKSDRIISLHLHGNQKICIISAYALTETSANDVKDRFYEDLKEVLLSIPIHTIIILAGDFNARLGKESRSTNSRIIGNNCYHDITMTTGRD